MIVRSTGTRLKKFYGVGVHALNTRPSIYAVNYDIYINKPRLEKTKKRFCHTVKSFSCQLQKNLCHQREHRLFSDIRYLGLIEGF